MSRFARPMLAAAALLTGATKPPPPVLAHNGPWNVHTSENACMLARVFGAGDAQVMVAFQPLFNAGTGELFVMTHDPHGGQRSGEATVTEQPSGRVERVPYFSNTLPHERKRITRITVPRSVWEGLSDTEILSVAAPPVSLRVRLVRFGAARPVFDTCERDLLTSWHVDPAVLDPDHAPTPLRNPASYFSAEDYPTAAISEGHVGRVVAVLGVDAAGLVTGCRIGSSSWPDLNDATCKQARRVRFRPGRDAAGRPAPSIYLLPVRWSMGGA